MEAERSLLNAAACAGDRDTFNQLVQENPFILSDTAMINSIENVLNTAIKSEHFQLATQIARTSNPRILTVQDRDGVRPLDVASAYGFIEMVHELLTFTPNPAEICRLPGKDGKSAIHHASINGRVDVIDELMRKCPDCVRDVTSFGETALHLAVKYYKFEAATRLLQCLERVGMMEVVNSQDKDGNTVLHYAASRKQLEIVELLLNENAATRSVVKVNTKNSSGLTAMDLVNIFIESSSDYRLRQVIQNANGSYGAALPSVPVQQPALEVPNAVLPEGWLNMIHYVKFTYGRDSPSELRNALLVVSALFITLGFQASISLPTQIFPDDPSPVAVGTSSNIGSELVQFLYLVGTTGLWSTSLNVMGFLIFNMPFKKEMIYASEFMAICWGCSIFSTRLSFSFKVAIVIVFLLIMLCFKLMPVLLTRIRIRHSNRNPTALSP